MSATVWDLVWERVRTELASLAAQAGATVRYDLGRSSNERFPLRVYMSLASDAQGREQVVVSVDCFLTDGVLALTTDIATGTGEVLCEGPARRVLANVALSEPEILDWSVDVASFIDRSAGVVRAHLASLG